LTEDGLTFLKVFKADRHIKLFTRLKAMEDCNTLEYKKRQKKIDKREFDILQKPELMMIEGMMTSTTI
jgi:hypothetical protein